MQDDTGEEKGIVEHGGGLVLFSDQPAHLKDMLMQPTLQPAEYVEERGCNQPRNEQFQPDQLLDAFRFGRGFD